MKSLIEKIADRTAHVVVVGIGYVGLPLVAEFARAGFRVTGYDKDAEKVRLLKAGESYIDDVASGQLHPYVTRRTLSATTDARVLAEADAVIVCVPTPLNKTREPDMTYILSSLQDIVAHRHKDMLVVLESTTYPGTTRELMLPRLTEGGYEIGKDLYLAFSPERVDPGNKQFFTKNTPKVMGGSTPACFQVARALYATAVDKIVEVSSTDAAELVKLLENTFRAVNIGLANEFAIMARRLGIDPWEVIRAASTKPFGFMPFYPGPGLGGHCIPIDPLYLSWKLRSLKCEARFIELADQVNSTMPRYVAMRALEELNERGRTLKDARVLISGVAYKANVSDVRESPALELIHELKHRGARIEYLDPHVPNLHEDGISMSSISPSANFAVYDLVIVVTAHANIDHARIAREAKLVLDTRDAMLEFRGSVSSIVQM